jgi:DNA-directed RNA polymerase subunit RPC12/RpoP
VINFRCPHCSQKIKANDIYAAKQVKCPKCGRSIQVPAAAEQSTPDTANVIKFRCPGCNQKIGLDKSYAGKTVRCARCKQSIKVPAGQPQPTKQPSPSTPFDEIGIGDMPGDKTFKDQLLDAEANAPPLDESLKLSSEPSPRQAVTQKRCPRCGELNPIDAAVCSICAFELSARPLAKARGSTNSKRTMVVAGICAMSLVLLGIVVWMILPNFKNIKPQNGPRFDEAKLLAENFVTLAGKGDLSAAKNLLEPQIQNNLPADRLERFAGFIGKNTISDANLGLTHFEPQQQGDCYFLSYNIMLDDDSKGLVVSVREINNDLKIDAIAAQQYFSKDSVQIGDKTYDELSKTVFTPAITGLGKALGRSCCAIVVVLGFLSLVQIISLWVVFNKAGQPGWAAVVPFYNMWVLAEVADKPGWMGLAAYFVGAVPYIGFILSLVFFVIISIGVAKTFNRGILFGLGLAFIPFIFYPVLAFATD